MFFAKIFEIFIARKKETSADSNIASKIQSKLVWFRLRISETAAAEPVRDFWIAYKAENERDITIILTEPRRIRNWLLVGFCFPNSDERIAAWLLPSPGRNEHKGEIREVERKGRRSSFLFIFTLFVWEGIIVFWEIEYNKVDEPNKPDKRGRRGSFILRLNVAIPKNPERIKIIRAQSFEFCSLEIRKITPRTRSQDIILWVNG